MAVLLHLLFHLARLAFGFFEEEQVSVERSERGVALRCNGGSC
jgi:hypothetical protein